MGYYIKNLSVRIFIALLPLLISFSSLAEGRGDSLICEKGKSVYLIKLHQEINNVASAKIIKGLEEARDAHADYCVMDINTYGGAVDAADSIRSAIIRSDIPVVAFINNQAISAGALICIACDSIYMRSGGAIGAATVINGQGEVLPDKFQSFMRATMRSTAESHGKKRVVVNGVEKEVWHRDPAIAERMVGVDSVLSFTPSEAIANGFCEGMAESVTEVITLILGSEEGDIANYNIVEQEITTLDSIIYFFMNPFLQGILLLLILGGIYFELQSPGIGFPLAASVTGAILYFAPLYLEGLAQNWELILFVLGVILLIVEIFVTPGFGVAGISGIAMMVVGLSFAMVDNDLLVVEGTINVRPLIKPFAIVLVSLVVSLFGSIYIASKLYGTALFSKIALETKLDAGEGYVGVAANDMFSVVGREAVVATDLKPSGSVEIDGRRYNAQAEHGFIAKGEKVVVSHVRGATLICSSLL